MVIGIKGVEQRWTNADKDAKKEPEKGSGDTLTDGK